MEVYMIRRLTLTLLTSLLFVANTPAAQKQAAAVQKTNGASSNAYQGPLLKVNRASGLFKHIDCHGITKTITLKNRFDKRIGIISYSVKFTKQQHQQPSGIINTVEIDEEFRGRNYGHLLVGESVRDMRAHACPVIELFACPLDHNDPLSGPYQTELARLIKFYTHLNFEVVGYELARTDGRTHVGAYMQYNPAATTTTP
jgi:ribosomal protein S18 acetylase RimI-like enzyme